MLKPLHAGGKVDFKVKAGQKWNDILECSALFIWKYEESLYENKQIGKNHKSAFQTCYHYFPTRALILIRWNETLNTSPPVTPSFRRAIRKCFWVCDSVFHPAMSKFLCFFQLHSLFIHHPFDTSYMTLNNVVINEVFFFFFILAQL